MRRDALLRVPSTFLGPLQGMTAFAVTTAIGTLAAAYAEAGRFADAVKAAQEAQTKAASAGQTEIAARNEELLKLYQAQKPYRVTR